MSQDSGTLKKIEHLLSEILRVIWKKYPTALQITQSGEKTMAITGVIIGEVGDFGVKNLPAGSGLPTNQALAVVWTCDDPAVQLTPSDDTLSCEVGVPATDTQGSAAAGTQPGFNLTATGTNADLPGPITTGPVFVPIIPAPVPLPTSLEMDQLS